jgi:uncharacterized protein (DUF488 family)
MQIIYTMGYTKKSLQEFVKLLTQNNIEKLIDIRLKNTSQLAGFAKAEDLKFILENFLKIKYEHIPLLSPSKDIFDKYKKNKDWEEYFKSFNNLMLDRKMDLILKEAITDNNKVCLLCSEDSPKKCHRKLLAEFYKKNSSIETEIIHLTKKDVN